MEARNEALFDHDSQPHINDFASLSGVKKSFCVVHGNREINETIYLFFGFGGRKQIQSYNAMMENSVKKVLMSHFLGWGWGQEKRCLDGDGSRLKFQASLVRIVRVTQGTNHEI